MEARNSYLRRQNALLSFLTLWNLWIFYLLYHFSWFPAGQGWQLSLCFILNCSKHVRKWLSLLSLKVAAWLQEPTYRLPPVQVITIASNLNDRLRTAGTLPQYKAFYCSQLRTKIWVESFILSRSNYLCLGPLWYQHIKMVLFFHPVLINSCFVTLSLSWPFILWALSAAFEYGFCKSCLFLFHCTSKN